MKKEFYTVAEVHQMGILPYRNVRTIRRMIDSGRIRGVRGMSEERPRMFVPHEEVERLKREFCRNKSMNGNVETK